jgi:transposase
MSAGPGRDPAKERRWRMLVAEQRRSGLTIAAFCLDRQLAVSAFHYWKRELRTRDAERRSTRPAARFLPVMLADAPTASPAHSASLLELALPSGEVLRVPAGFDPVTLAQVLAVLRGEPACSV